MKKYGAFLFPLFLVAILIVMQKPKPPVFTIGISAVTLADTLPLATYSTLHVKEINGVRIQHADGQTAFYFEYETDHSKLLDAIGRSEFARYSTRADTQCRPISFEKAFDEHGLKLSDEERASTSFFHQISDRDFDYFECIKTPLKHTILLDKHSNRTLHRIEMI